MPEPDRPVVLADCRELDCDVATVEALARLALDALRLGCRLRIEGASNELRDLITYLGLEDVLLAHSEVNVSQRGPRLRRGPTRT